MVSKLISGPTICHKHDFVKKSIGPYLIIFVVVVIHNSSDRFKFPFNDFNFEINTQVNPISRVHDSDSNDWNRLLGANESDIVQYYNNQFSN